MVIRSWCCRLVGLLVASTLRVAPAAAAPTASHLGDASDLYAWTPRPGHLAVVLMVQPFATGTTRFATGVDRRILVRRATISGTGADVQVATGDELQINCTVQRGKKRAEDRMRCEAVGPKGRQTVEAQVGDEVGTTNGAMRLFAGPRLDPFFINILTIRQARPRDGDRKPPYGPDSISPGWIKTRSLAVVLDLDLASLFGDAAGLFAVGGETDLDGARRDRLARPEITGFILSKNWGEPLPGDDVRGIWNREPTFAMAAENVPFYQAAMAGGLARLDALDQYADPEAAGPPAPPDWPTPHPLKDLLLLDVLLVDPTRACTANQPTFFEIEMASYRGLPADETGARNRTCGGRTLNHDSVDAVLTLLINGPDRVPPGPPFYGPDGAYAPARSDGIDRPRTPATDEFPYLQGP